MAHMRSAWGSIEKIDRGRYRLRWWEERDGAYKRRSKTVRGTRKQAAMELARIRAALEEDPWGHARRVVSGVTVREAYEGWWLPLADERLGDGRLARNTFRGYQTRWRRDVGPTFGDVPCAEVGPKAIQEWLDGMTQKPAIDSLALLRQVLDLAVTHEVVAENRARVPFVMPKAHEDRSDGAYTLQELDRIARAAEGSPCEAAMLLSMFGSCRTGESLGVRLPEVTRAEAHGVRVTVCDVVRQVNSDASVSDDGHLKNRQSVRPVVVPEPWGDRLWRIAEEARSKGWEWLCDDHTGRPLGQNRLRREWAKAVEKAGVPAKQPRAARRSWETYMRWTMGVEQSKVEQMMGHALPGVTGAHYDKPAASQFVEVVAAAFAARPFVREERKEEPAA